MIAPHIYQLNFDKYESLHMLLPEADLFPRSISVIGERKEPVKEATPNSSPTSEDGASKKKFKWNIKVRELCLHLTFQIAFISICMCYMTVSILWR